MVVTYKQIYFFEYITNLLDLNVGSGYVALDAILDPLDAGPAVQVGLYDPEPLPLSHAQRVLGISLEVKQSHGKRLLRRGEWRGRGWRHILEFIKFRISDQECYV